MCGLNFLHDGEGYDIEGMNSLISRRGLPGRQKTLEVNGRAFGHVRLPIQGLEEDFDQPYIYKDWIFLFVGEIYNYKEFNKEARSDIVVLAELWDSFGGIHHYGADGMWSFIAYDRKEDMTYVVTDYLAKKPLYIHTPTNSVSSEIKALCHLGTLTLDELYFSCVSKWGYCMHNLTPFNEIRKIPANTVLTINSKGERNYKSQGPLEPSSKYMLREHLERAVKNRLVSDVPVSLLLSGGLDSSIIYKLVRKHTDDITIFHIDNGEEEFLEDLEIPCRIKVKKLKLEKHTKKRLREILYFNESPVDLGSMLSQFYLSQAITGSGLHVALSGDGADELFGGYTRISDYDSQMSDIYEELVFYHLPRLDKLMMAFTVELRCPYLSLDVLQDALALPYKERVHKKFLKKTFADILPKRILERKKIALKSPQVKERGLEWRYELIKQFRKETISEYQRC